MAKQRCLLIFVLFILLLAGCSTGGQTNAKEAAADNNDPEDNRIISTTVAVTEIMDALEIDLIGVPTSYKELPERYDGLPEVGNPMGPDMELLLSLQPKKVISVTTLKSDLDSIFTNAGVDATYMNLESMDDMLAGIEALGKEFDREEQATKIVGDFEAKVAAMKEKTAGKESPSVLILMGVPGSYLVATDQSYLGDLVSKAGGNNVFSGEKVEYLASNTEHLQQTNPDIILRTAHGMPDEVVKMFDREFKENDIWKHFSAVTNDRVYDLKEPLFGTTGNLRVGEALDVLYDIFYNEADAN